MKTERLSFAIAQHFEPEPTAEDTEFYLNTRQRKPHNGWWDIARHGGKPVDSVSSYYWRPLPYDSPQVAMRLLKDLLAKGYCVMQVGNGFTVCWPKDVASQRFYDTPSGLFEAAIAIAFAKANNIAEES